MLSYDDMIFCGALLGCRSAKDGGPVTERETFLEGFLNCRPKLARELAQEDPSFIPIARLIDDHVRVISDMVARSVVGEEFARPLFDMLWEEFYALAESADYVAWTRQPFKRKVLLACTGAHLWEKDDEHVDGFVWLLQDDPQELRGMAQIYLAFLTLWYADFRGYRHRVIRAFGLKDVYDEGDGEIRGFVRTAVSRRDVDWMLRWLDRYRQPDSGRGRNDSHASEARRWIVLYRELVRVDIRFPTLDEWSTVVLAANRELLYGGGIGIVGADFFIARDQECIADPYLDSAYGSLSASDAKAKAVLGSFVDEASAEALARRGRGESVEPKDTEWGKVAAYVAKTVGFGGEIVFGSLNQNEDKSDLTDAAQNLAHGAPSGHEERPKSRRGKHFKQPTASDEVMPAAQTDSKPRHRRVPQLASPATPQSALPAAPRPSAAVPVETRSESSREPVVAQAVREFDQPEKSHAAEPVTGSASEVRRNDARDQQVAATDAGGLVADKSEGLVPADEGDRAPKSSEDGHALASSYESYRYPILGVVALLDFMALGSLSVGGVLLMLLVTVVGLGVYGALSELCDKDVERTIGIAAVPAGVSVIYLLLAGFVGALPRAILLAAAAAGANYVLPAIKDKLALLGGRAEGPSTGSVTNGANVSQRTGNSSGGSDKNAGVGTRDEVEEKARSIADAEESQRRMEEEVARRVGDDAQRRERIARAQDEFRRAELKEEMKYMSFDEDERGAAIMASSIKLCREKLAGTWTVTASMIGSRDILGVYINRFSYSGSDGMTQVAYEGKRKFPFKVFVTGDEAGRCFLHVSGNPLNGPGGFLATFGEIAFTDDNDHFTLNCKEGYFLLERVR